MGKPVRLIGGPGEQNDIVRAEEMVDGLTARATIGDKGYDADRLSKRSPGKAAESSSRPNATARPSAPTTKTSTSSAT